MRDKKGKFIKGHRGYKAMLGKKFTPFQLKRLSDAHKGQVCIWKGKKLNKKWRENLRLSHLGNKASQQQKIK